MGEYALYKVIQTCIGSNENGSVEFQKDDVVEILVQSLFSKNKSDKHGWLYAYNRKTMQSGYIPVEYIKLLGSEVNKTIHHPSALGIEDVSFATSSGIIDTDGRINIKHNFHSLFVVKPILCNYCRDYIWGRGRICIKCRDCHACFHSICTRRSSNLCQKIPDVHQPLTNFDKEYGTVINILLLALFLIGQNKVVEITGKISTHANVVPYKVTAALLIVSSKIYRVLKASSERV
ncbi:hypothetical protein WA026_010460 [Henosepilachna vigintioctopunctata]|uniref:SH3 domain-containing protein n=1 Tax=Henosepilachna vigintioctopunctata TaxID=420089 RepID=A0AAW1V3X4_9CUCU